MGHDDGMRIHITLEKADIDRLMRVMSRIRPTDANGKLRSITIPDAIRESIRLAEMAGRK